jgi:hypothetical protein
MPRWLSFLSPASVLFIAIGDYLVDLGKKLEPIRTPIFKTSNLDFNASRPQPLLGPLSDRLGPISSLSAEEDQMPGENLLTTSLSKEGELIVKDSDQLPQTSKGNSLNFIDSRYLPVCPGDQLYKRYFIVFELGRGLFSQVWLVYDSR